MKLNTKNMLAYSRSEIRRVRYWLRLRTDKWPTTGLPTPDIDVDGELQDYRMISEEKLFTRLFTICSFTFTLSICSSLFLFKE